MTKRLKEFYDDLAEDLYYPYRMISNPAVVGVGEVGKIMFVSLCPAKLNDRKNFEQFFNRQLKKVDLSPRDYFFTHLSKTSIIGDKNGTLGPALRDRFRRDLRFEIIQVRPMLVVLLGKIVQEFFAVKQMHLPKRKRFGTRRCLLVGIHHPGYARRSSAAAKKTTDDLAYLSKLYRELLWLKNT